MKKNSLIVLVFFSGLLYSCTDTTIDKPIKDIDSLKLDSIPVKVEDDSVVAEVDQVSYYNLSQDDKAVLGLFQTIEMGFSFVKVKANYKMVKGIRPEEKKDELANEGYTESVCKQNLFAGVAVAEFNFKNDSLYSFFFTFSDKDTEKAEQIFQAVKRHYSATLGMPALEEVEEENHYNQNYSWPAKKGVVPYVYFNLNTNTIIWGKRIEKVVL